MTSTVGGNRRERTKCQSYEEKQKYMQVRETRPFVECSFCMDSIFQAALWVQSPSFAAALIKLHWNLKKHILGSANVPSGWLTHLQFCDFLLNSSVSTEQFASLFQKSCVKFLQITNKKKTKQNKALMSPFLTLQLFIQKSSWVDLLVFNHQNDMKIENAKTTKCHRTHLRV